MQIKQVSTLNIDDTIEVFYKPNSKITDYLGPSIVWKVIAKNHSGYPNGSVTLMSSKGIASLPFDAKEPNNTDLYNRNYGNNRWKFSNIRQWLNSDKKGDQVDGIQRNISMTLRLKIPEFILKFLLQIVLKIIIYMNIILSLVFYMIWIKHLLILYFLLLLILQHIVVFLIIQEQKLQKINFSC